MKRDNPMTKVTSFFLGAGLALSAAGAWAAVAENNTELITTGDFDGDGRPDIVIVDRDTGKYRLGYQKEAGIFTWINFRASGLRFVAGVSVGKLIDPKVDALVFASSDGNQVVVIDASDSAKAIPGVVVPFTKLGPSTAVAVDIGGAGNTPLDDLYIGCENETPAKGFLVRNDGKQFTILSEEELAGAPAKGIRFSPKAGQPGLVGMVIRGDDKTTFRVDDLSSGKIVPVTTTEIPADCEYVLGNFTGSPLGELVTFKTNENKLVVYPLEEAAGKLQFGAAKTNQTEKPVGIAAAVPVGSGSKLLLAMDIGETADLCTWDGAGAPKSILQLTNWANEHFYAAATLPDTVVLLSSPTLGKPKYSTRYTLVRFENGTPAIKATGSLATLIESDEWTVAEVHKQITAKLDVKSPADMKAYTNTIPGTDVKFAMVPIPGGVFTMGSPDKEAGRQADEGPQHKVQIEPFWMGAFELTWNEYELFMFPDDEKRLRTQFPTEEYVNKVSDAVTRPSKPYADMTFGMGKSGFPAISMTQHGANKYCQWLSAKTGHFYRLPTEAEWEYAARAGTTTAYFFGDDPKDLIQYAWYGKNSDWKYQKIGKKKPNPWGLYDICGNVVEWCLDQYDPEFYKAAGDQVAVEPWNKSTKPYPHSVRGGCWDDDDPAKCRSAARRGSDKSWKMQDPQLPKSVWYFTDAQWVGFRLVRPLKVPSPEDLKKCWISGTERD
jgi:formylglycine-generating enzyme required for sulfatase activity